MKNILFISYQFPPLAGPGVHRSLNFVKNLRDFNYNPIIIKADEKKMNHDTIKIDHSLLTNLPKDLTIINTHPFNFDRTRNFLMKLKLFRIFWFIFYPLFWTTGALWPFLIFSKVKKEALTYKTEIVYTTSGPFNSWILGYLLKRKLKLKWVADIRDPFTDGYMWLFPSKFHWLIARKFEKWILSKADHIIVNTNEVKQLYQKRKIKTPEKITCITNGY